VSRRATIRDVAMAAGVSIGTVSNVLTGAKPVAAPTRVAIEVAIERLGYAPDQAGRVLNSRRRRDPAAPPPGMPRLTTVGYLCADLTARLEVLPGADERAQARLIEETLGGAAANVAAVAAGLGPPLAVWTELMTRLGVDAHSDWAAGLLASRGVALTEGSRRPDGHLSRCIILVDAEGSRTIVNEPLQVPKADLLAWLAGLRRQPGRHCLHIQGDQLEELLDVLPAARSRGLLLSCHAPGMRATLRSPAAIRRLADLLDLVFLDGPTARAVTGMSATANCLPALRALAGTATLVVTLGAEGAALLEPGQRPVRVLAGTVVPVDRTGAGDCFVGTYLAAWLAGRPAADAARLAVLAASRSVLVPGAQEYRPTADELAGALEEEGV